MKSHETSRAPRPVPEESFRHRLQAELARRCADNPRYSLRAFAAHLDVDHSSLSQILRDRRRLTEESIRRFGKRLGLDDVEVARYVSNQERIEIRRAEPRPEAVQLTRLAQDAAEVVGGWQHFALLELTRLEGFRADSRWVARVLGLTVDEVNLALQRLVRLRLLRMEGPDRWVDLTGDAVLDASGLDRVTLGRVVSQALALSREAFEQAPEELREHSATTLALDSRRLDEVRARIARFREELRRAFDQPGSPDDVYRLDLTFYPVTRHRPKTEEDPIG